MTSGMPVAVHEHRVNGRQPLGRVNGPWHGVITCRCGWEREVGPCPDSTAAMETMNRCWKQHAVPSGLPRGT
jgi:hypothetical protein